MRSVPGHGNAMPVTRSRARTTYGRHLGTWRLEVRHAATRPPRPKSSAPPHAVTCRSPPPASPACAPPSTNTQRRRSISSMIHPIIVDGLYILYSNQPNRPKHVASRSTKRKQRISIHRLTLIRNARSYCTVGAKEKKRCRRRR